MGYRTRRQGGSDRLSAALLIQYRTPSRTPVPVTIMDTERLKGLFIKYSLFCVELHCTMKKIGLVEHLHTDNYHAGTQLLLSIIREKYWILGGRRTVRKIWNACVKCRRFKSKSPTADPVSLPADRVKDAAVFEV
ncbi:hypothetical protein AVEN_275607-1, partial [Araneus ventricosus]